MSLDELEGSGIERMDEAEIDGFLSSQGVGVLGLPTDGAPYMLPMSFGFDGDESLYFTYVTGTESRKGRLSERTDRARFLVYNAPSRFSWQSASLTGELTIVPESEWDEVSDVMANAWHPDALEAAKMEGSVSVFRFRIERKEGIKQTGLPPEYRAEE